MKLRTLLTGLTIVVTLLALAVTAALVLLTRSLHRTSERLASSVASVVLVEEAEVDLLRYARPGNESLHRDLATEILRRLEDARLHVPRGRQRRDLTMADDAVRDYLHAVASGAPAVTQDELHTAAIDALESLAGGAVGEATQSRAAAARTDALADLLGLCVGGLLLALTGTLLWWLRARAFQPILQLAAVMEKFGRGDRDARAAERGPAELRDVARRFNQMAEALSQRRHAQMAFLGGVAHDLRSPVSAIASTIGLLTDAVPLPESRRPRVVALAQRQITRLDRMIGDLLDIARIEAGELVLHIEEIDVAALVRDAVETWRSICPDHHIEARVPAGRLAAECDPLRIEQVVGNLLSNAVKYSPASSRVDISLVKEGDEVAIAVADQGIGIGEDDQARLFEPFRRVGLSTETIPGTGLGLFVVRRIVEAHAGRIELQSEAGRGSRFTLRLPVSQEGRVPRRPTPESESALVH